MFLWWHLLLRSTQKRGLQASGARIHKSQQETEVYNVKNNNQLVIIQIYLIYYVYKETH